METYTFKRIIKELLPKHYDVSADEKFEIVFPDQIVDGSIGGIQLNKKLLATFKFRFTNSIAIFNEVDDAYLKVNLTDLVYCVKEPFSVVEEVDNIEAESSNATLTPSVVPVSLQPVQTKVAPGTKLAEKVAENINFVFNI